MRMQEIDKDYEPGTPLEKLGLAFQGLNSF